MHKAAAAGAVESLELLVSAGFDPGAFDDKCSPLHHAAMHGRMECVSFLCIVARNTGTSRNRRTGDTPLHCAIRSG